MILYKEHFHINDFTQRIIHMLRQKARKWSIAWIYKVFFCCHALIRLKEEQRWIGMPEWKKHLLRRRGTDQLYHGYHAVNTGHPGIRRTMSWKLPEMSAEEECDEVTRARAISTLE